MYDKTPVYPHQEHLYWAHEPWKSIYVWQRLFTTLLLVPIWALYHLLTPRSTRPRPSWSITQIIVVKFTKRIYKVTEVAGVTWGTRDPTKAPDERTLKETRFAWVPPLPEELRTGIVDDKEVACMKVGTFIWPKSPPASVRVRCEVPHPTRGEKGLHPHEKRVDNINIVTSAHDDDAFDGETTTAASSPAIPHKQPHFAHLTDAQFFTGDADANVDIESDAADAPPRMIGIFLHGGGYCHMSAHENSGTSRIPRRLIKDKLFQEIHAVEYRLLQHAPIPAAIQDAAAVYAHLVTHHLGAEKGPDGKYRYPTPPVQYHTHAPLSPTLQGVVSPNSQPTAAGLLSPNWRSTDTAPQVPAAGLAMPPGAVTDAAREQRFNEGFIRDANGNVIPRTPLLSGNDAQPKFIKENMGTSSNASAGSSTALLDEHPVDRHRPRIILIGDSAGGNLVLALARWIRDEGVLPVPDGMMLLSPSCDPSHTLPQVPASRRPRPHSDTDYLLDTPEPRALMQRTFLGTHPIEMVYSPYVSPASEWVLSVFHGKDTLDDLVPLAGAGDDRAYTETTAPVRTTASNPYIRVPPGMGLFTEFPRALVVVGDAERLEREVVALEKGMERDGVRVRMVWAKDAVHDILIMGAWDERVREGVWREIRKWVKEIAEQ